MFKKIKNGILFLGLIFCFQPSCLFAMEGADSHPCGHCYFFDPRTGERMTIMDLSSGDMCSPPCDADLYNKDLYHITRCSCERWRTSHFNCQRVDDVVFSNGEPSPASMPGSDLSQTLDTGDGGAGGVITEDYLGSSSDFSPRGQFGLRNTHYPSQLSRRPLTAAEQGVPSALQPLDVIDQAALSTYSASQIEERLHNLWMQEGIESGKSLPYFLTSQYNLWTVDRVREYLKTTYPDAWKKAIIEFKNKYEKDMDFREYANKYIHKIGEFENKNHVEEKLEEYHVPKWASKFFGKAIGHKKNARAARDFVEAEYEEILQEEERIKDAVVVKKKIEEDMRREESLRLAVEQQRLEREEEQKARAIRIQKKQENRKKQQAALKEEKERSELMRQRAFMLSQMLGQTDEKKSIREQKPEERSQMRQRLLRRQREVLSTAETRRDRNKYGGALLSQILGQEVSNTNPQGEAAFTQERSVGRGSVGRGRGRRGRGRRGSVRRARAIGPSYDVDTRGGLAVGLGNTAPAGVLSDLDSRITKGEVFLTEKPTGVDGKGFVVGDGITVVEDDAMVGGVDGLDSGGGGSGGSESALSKYGRRFSSALKSEIVHSMAYEAERLAVSLLSPQRGARYIPHRSHRPAVLDMFQARRPAVLDKFESGFQDGDAGSAADHAAAADAALAEALYIEEGEGEDAEVDPGIILDNLDSIIDQYPAEFDGVQVTNMPGMEGFVYTLPGGTSIPEALRGIKAESKELKKEFKDIPQGDSFYFAVKGMRDLSKIFHISGNIEGADLFLKFSHTMLQLGNKTLPWIKSKTPKTRAAIDRGLQEARQFSHQVMMDPVGTVAEITKSIGASSVEFAKLMFKIDTLCSELDQIPFAQDPVAAGEEAATHAREFFSPVVNATKAKLQELKSMSGAQLADEGLATTVKLFKVYAKSQLSGGALKKAIETIKVIEGVVKTEQLIAQAGGLPAVIGTTLGQTKKNLVKKSLQGIKKSVKKVASKPASKSNLRTKRGTKHPRPSAKPTAKPASKKVRSVQKTKGTKHARSGQVVDDRGGKRARGAAELVDKDLAQMYDRTVLGKGHTGRKVPKSLGEQLAMKETLSNPLLDATELRGVKMTDSRWLAEDGWVKMSKNVNGTEIHFVHNTRTLAFDDFKFK